MGWRFASLGAHAYARHPEKGGATDAAGWTRASELGARLQPFRGVRPIGRDEDHRSEDGIGRIKLTGSAVQGSLTPLSLQAKRR